MPPRILVVDSHGDVRTLIRALLDEDYLHVDEAEDREQAIRLLNARSYAALVIESSDLPEESGILRMIREERPEMLARTIVMFSGASNGLIGNSDSIGVAFVMDKPVDAAELRVAIRNLTSSVPEQPASRPTTGSGPTVH